MNENKMAVALLLEDEPLISMDLEVTLADARFDVVPIMTCSDAMAWLDDNVADIAIVDIALLDGPSTPVVERLIDARIPFVVHSGDVPDVYEGTPFASGLWVSKPVDGEDLVRVASGLVSGS